VDGILRLGNGRNSQPCDQRTERRERKSPRHLDQFVSEDSDFEWGGWAHCQRDDSRRLHNYLPVQGYFSLRCPDLVVSGTVGTLSDPLSPR